MAKENTKCPMCGTKLKLIDGRMSCKKCGYYIRNQENRTDTLDTGYQNTATYGSGQGGSYSSSQSSGQNASYGSSQFSGQNASYGSSQFSGQSGSYGSARGSAGTYRGSSATRSSGETNRLVAVVTAVCLAVLCLSLLGAIVLFRAGVFSQSPAGTSSAGNTADRQEEAASSSVSSPDDYDTSSPAPMPEAVFFREMSEAIWGKSYLAITPGEYAGLILLQINEEDNVIYYQLRGEEIRPLYFHNSSGMDMADLAAFPGLEVISVDDDLDWGDLDGLHNLYSVDAENTIAELAEIVPHPENILALCAEDSIFTHNLTGIESFPNLQSLYVDYGSLEDISALTQFPNLTALALIDCDDLADYSPLLSLTKLNTLSITSSQLKSIDFIREMPSLTSLGIGNTKISSLSALESCPGLTALSLTDNYEIEDYSIVSQLTGLTSLELGVSYGGELPSLAGLTQLQQLSVKYAGDLTPLQDAVNLTYLSLKECSGWELDTLTALQNLQTLVINDFSSYVDSLEPLTHLPCLTALSLEDTKVFGNMEEIFGIPTLQYLYLDNCQIGLDFDALPSNDALEMLSMNELRVLRDPTFNNGDLVSLAEHCDMFAHFPSLKELYLRSLELDNIEFVADLPLLQYLDITDNRVTSLKPLESLADFQAVWCGRNTILEKLPEDSSISVYSEN